MAAGLIIIAGLLVFFETTGARKARASQFENCIADHEETYNGQNAWWYHDASGNIDPNVTTVACNAYGWWYVENGRVNFDYTGFQSNENGSWRIVNGQVDFSANGLYQNEDDWWYVENGKVNFDYTGIQSDENGSWYIVNGQVDFSANGLYQSEDDWWYIVDGKVDYDFYGYAQNENGLWYCISGKVDYEYSSRMPGIKRVLAGDSRVLCMCWFANDPTDGYICRSGIGYDYFVDTEIPEIEQVLWYLPNVESVIINIGVNDIILDKADVEATAYKYAAAINRLTAKYPNIKFYFASLFYMGVYTAEYGILTGEEFNPYIYAFNEKMKNICYAEYIPLCEYVSENNIQTGDGLHIFEQSKLLRDYIVQITG